jgi:hypothetical protein
MAAKYLYQHLPLQDPPKFTQIGSFYLKICHLATLTIDLTISAEMASTEAGAIDARSRQNEGG